MINQRISLKITGIVQGVGFRPFIFNLAISHQLSGWVCNSSEGVFIEAEGEPEEVQSFIAEISAKAPPQSMIESIEVKHLETSGDTEFIIRPSITEPGKFQPVSPDIATCSECLDELFDKNDRRFHYPFINCTNCGPRFTIIEKMPYDRPLTTMRAFKMCPECQQEYDDPGNRRFHAQPNACVACGPKVTLVDPSEKMTSLSSEPIVAAGQLLIDGKIVAIKGLGGYHLACDATSEEAVNKLRQRKRRFGKPLAIMVPDLETARELAFINDAEQNEMLSARRPIVLVHKRDNAAIADSVAPGTNYLGIMLPYTPLNYLLLAEVRRPLVMTSGNITEEPIAMENEEAFHRLGQIADYFLIHDRQIYSRYDDSVVRVIDGHKMVIRRARGFAPEPLSLDFDAEQVLACGPELKNTFCLTRERHAFVSQHIGDLENLETLEHFENTVELYKRLFNVDPKIIAYDLHPEYLSTKYAKSLDIPEKVGVQHHHAHIAGCLEENRLYGPVIGIAYDGSGYGLDGSIWGGEFLIADQKEFTRAGHLQTARMPGGSAAIDKPFRMALSYLYRAYGKNYFRPQGGFWDSISQEEEAIAISQIEKGVNSPLTSSCGRLFDAVSAIIGIRGAVDYEGQAAVELEANVADEHYIPYSFTISTDEHGLYVIMTDMLIKDVAEDIKLGTTRNVIAARFHATVTAFTLAMCKQLRGKYGQNAVALSGGVWQNAILWKQTRDALEKEHFDVIDHITLPPNDGCISFGQAVVANARCRSRTMK